MCPFSSPLRSPQQKRVHLTPQLPKQRASDSQPGEQPICQAPHHCKVTLTCVTHQGSQVKAVLFNIHAASPLTAHMMCAQGWGLGALFRDGGSEKHTISVSLMS